MTRENKASVVDSFPCSLEQFEQKKDTQYAFRSFPIYLLQPDKRCASARGQATYSTIGGRNENVPNFPSFTNPPNDSPPSKIIELFPNYSKILMIPKSDPPCRTHPSPRRRSSPIFFTPPSWGATWTRRPSPWSKRSQPSAKRSPPSAAPTGATSRSRRVSRCRTATSQVRLFLRARPRRFAHRPKRTLILPARTFLISC